MPPRSAERVALSSSRPCTRSPRRSGRSPKRTCPPPQDQRLRSHRYRVSQTRAVDPSVETFAQLVVVLLGGLLLLRVGLSLPGWLSRKRRPETRSILVVGVGGGGGNAVDRMVEAGTEGVGFIACNTDAQALRASRASTRIRIGDAITRGLGAGGDPTIGRRAAEEDQDKIARALA